MELIGKISAAQGSEITVSNINGVVCISFVGDVKYDDYLLAKGNVVEFYGKEYHRTNSDDVCCVYGKSLKIGSNLVAGHDFNYGLCDYKSWPDKYRWINEVKTIRFPITLDAESPVCESSSEFSTFDKFAITFGVISFGFLLYDLYKTKYMD